jgi:hypothetical protein
MKRHSKTTIFKIFFYIILAIIELAVVCLYNYITKLHIVFYNTYVATTEIIATTTCKICV